MKNGFSSLDLPQIKFVRRGCDLCGVQEGELLCSVRFLDIKFNFIRCSCGLVYQNPMLDKDSRKHIYETVDYWAYKYKGSNNSNMLNYYSYLEEEDDRRRTAKIRIKWMSPYLPEGSRILDLGCSDGLFVHALSESGYRASGVDISEVMISYGRKTYGVDISRVDFEDEWPFNETFDAITCYATLSNIINPSRVFENVRRYLRPGGLFFFNFGCIDRLVSKILGSRLYLYRPTVATIYSKKTVTTYCERNGLILRYLINDIQVVPVARLVGFFRIPGSLWFLKCLGLEDTSMRMWLLTGYSACASRDG